MQYRVSKRVVYPLRLRELARSPCVFRTRQYEALRKNEAKLLDAEEKIAAATRAHASVEDRVWAKEDEVQAMESALEEASESRVAMRQALALVTESARTHSYFSS